LIQILKVNPQTILDIRDLDVSFAVEKQDFKAVDHISFSLMPGETLAIVGESGSGKTVTALAVLRLIPEPPGKVKAGGIWFRQPDGSQINLLTLDVRRLQSIRGRQISMIFQEPMSSLNPVFSCGDQVAESLRVHLGLNKHMAKEKVIELFEEVRFARPKEVYSSYPHQLSGGQKQRVMIAMAIACNPSILIADEPTTALDVTVQKTIIELLVQLQESRKMSILFITHDLGLVHGFAHRVLVMNSGKIVEQGTVSQIFHSPEHPYTKGLMACRPKLDVRLERLPTVSDFMSDSSGINPRMITDDQRKFHHKEIYSREPILRVENLGKQYERRKVLDAAGFDVFQGETLGIVGESGSGKTTLARVALELIPASEGRVLYKGKDITRLSKAKMKELRKELQIVFQDPYSSLNPRLAVGLAISEPMKINGHFSSREERIKKAMELMEKVGLNPQQFYRFPHEFSGGQRQRICIARALAVEPALIICDESVSALDVSIQAQVLNLLNDLKKEYGLTYIFISHDLAVVKYMSDRIIVMQNGRIVEIGEADEIFKTPASEYTRSLLAAIPRF
jgi:peptide/nickel transport system ATP-binding protein